MLPPTFIGKAIEVNEDTQSLALSHVLYSKRAQRDSKFFQYYRCFTPCGEVELSARVQRFGKPFMVYAGLDDGSPVIEVKNAKNYLVNGRTEVRELASGNVLGSYTRLNAVLDMQGDKLGRWVDARSWSETFKENLVDTIANAALGSGDGTVGANTGDTHLLLQGKNLLARLQRERMSFFPDPPSTGSRGRIARIAGRMIPGELGRSIRENLPPYGWSLSLAQGLPPQFSPRFILCIAILRIQMLRYLRMG